MSASSSQCKVRQWTQEDFEDARARAERRQVIMERNVIRADVLVAPFSCGNNQILMPECSKSTSMLSVVYNIWSLRMIECFDHSYFTVVLQSFVYLGYCLRHDVVVLCIKILEIKLPLVIIRILIR
jgi:hypothetical protein